MKKLPRIFIAVIVTTVSALSMLTSSTPSRAEAGDAFVQLVGYAESVQVDGKELVPAAAADGSTRSALFGTRINTINKDDWSTTALTLNYIPMAAGKHSITFGTTTKDGKKASLSADVDLVSGKYYAVGPLGLSDEQYTTEGAKLDVVTLSDIFDKANASKSCALFVSNRLSDFTKDDKGNQVSKALNIPLQVLFKGKLQATVNYGEFSVIYVPIGGQQEVKFKPDSKDYQAASFRLSSYASTLWLFSITNLSKDGSSFSFNLSMPMMSTILAGQDWLKAQQGTAQTFQKLGKLWDQVVSDGENPIKVISEKADPARTGALQYILFAPTDTAFNWVSAANQKNLNDKADARKAYLFNHFFTPEIKSDKGFSWYSWGIYLRSDDSLTLTSASGMALKVTRSSGYMLNKTLFAMPDSYSNPDAIQTVDGGLIFPISGVIEPAKK